MIRIGNIRVPLDFDFSALDKFCTEKLGISREKLRSVKLAKKSVDARKKSDVHFIISLEMLFLPKKSVIRSILFRQDVQDR